MNKIIIKSDYNIPKGLITSKEGLVKKVRKMPYDITDLEKNIDTLYDTIYDKYIKLNNFGKVNMRLVFLIYIVKFYEDRDYKKIDNITDVLHLNTKIFNDSLLNNKRDKGIVDENVYKNGEIKGRRFYFKYGNYYLEYKPDVMALINISDIYSLIDENNDIIRIIKSEKSNSTKIYFKDLEWFDGFKKCLNENEVLVHKFLTNLLDNKTLSDLLDKLSDFIELD